MFFILLLDEGCNIWEEEVKIFGESGLPRTAPNSMNNYGLILNDVGYQEMLSWLLEEYLNPICQFLYKSFLGNGKYQLDNHHSFVVEYAENEDRSLAMHSDDSEITFNVNICDRFEGSGLTFCGMIGDVDRRNLSYRYNHKRGLVCSCVCVMFFIFFLLKRKMCGSFGKTCSWCR